jgi:hypothetical protein
MHKAPAIPIPVDVRFDGRWPTGVRIRGRWRPVSRVIDYWRETGCWWDGELEREFLRVEAGEIVVIGRARRGSDKQWRLYAVDD